MSIEKKKKRDGNEDSHYGLLGNTSISLFTFSHVEHRYKCSQVECGFLLDVVVRESAAFFKLLVSEDKALLVRRTLGLGNATSQYVNPCYETDVHGA